MRWRRSRRLGQELLDDLAGDVSVELALCAPMSAPMTLPMSFFSEAPVEAMASSTQMRVLTLVCELGQKLLDHAESAFSAFAISGRPPFSRPSIDLRCFELCA